MPLPKKRSFAAMSWSCSSRLPCIEWAHQLGEMGCVSRQVSFFCRLFVEPFVETCVRAQFVETFCPVVLVRAPIRRILETLPKRSWTQYEVGDQRRGVG